MESLDLVALRQLDDLEREKARQLLQPLLDDGDPRAVDALGELQTQKAWADVERVFDKGWGSAQIHAAMWLWLKQQDPRSVPKLRSMIAANADAPTFLLELVATIARIPGAEADDALIDALASKHLRVVGGAATALFTRYGWDAYEHEGAPIFTLRCGLTSDFPSVRTDAITELRGLLGRKRAGESDAQLGVVGAPLASRSAALGEIVQLAFRGTAAALPTTATLDKLQGGERDWALDLLLGRLEQNDARVIPLLQHLGGNRVLAALSDYNAGRRVA